MEKKGYRSIGVSVCRGVGVVVNLWNWEGIGDGWMVG